MAFRAVDDVLARLNCRDARPIAIELPNAGRRHLVGSPLASRRLGLAIGLEDNSASESAGRSAG
ncbi:MAG: hypothetical protein U0790_18895 [Isosphaeraceae bacterium]